MKKVAIILLTYNRKKYLKRCLDQLNKRFGYKFDLYVFDDCSDEYYIDHVLENYNIDRYVYKAEEHIGIQKQLVKQFSKVPDIYDFYIKLDQDIEILTDSFFPQILEVINYKYHDQSQHMFVPKLEGHSSNQGISKEIEFYNGHVLTPKPNMDIGQCIIFDNLIFKEIKNDLGPDFEPKDTFGFDSVIWKYGLNKGVVPIIEDLSIYHIDNFYGQRKDFDYFTKRSRWGIIDIGYPWFLKISQEILPFSLYFWEYNMFYKLSETYEEFSAKIKNYIETEQYIIFRKEHNRNQDNEKILVYKITYPDNFPGKCHQMTRGESKYFIHVPEWAKDNLQLVVEQEYVPLEIAIKLQKVDQNNIKN